MLKSIIRDHQGSVRHSLYRLWKEMLEYGWMNLDLKKLEEEKESVRSWICEKIVMKGEQWVYTIKSWIEKLTRCYIKEKLMRIFVEEINMENKQEKCWPPFERNTINWSRVATKLLRLTARGINTCLHVICQCLSFRTGTPLLLLSLKAQVATFTSIVAGMNFHFLTKWM